MPDRLPLAQARVAASGRVAAIGRAAAARRIGWDPRFDLPGVLAGWDLSKYVGALDDPITTVEDWITGTHPLSQATGSAKFLYKPTGVNGRPAMYGKSDDWMSADTLAAGLSDDNTFSLFLVLWADLPTSTSTFWSAGKASSNGNLRLFHVLGATEIFGFRKLDDAGVTVTGSVSFPGFSSLPRFVVLTKKPGFLFDLWIDGVKIITDVSGGLGGVTALTRFSFWVWRRSSNTQFGEGFFGESFISSQVVSDTIIRAAYDKYAKPKWGLS